MKFLIALVAASVLGACSLTEPSAGESVRFILNETTVSPGDTLTGSLINESGRRAGYNLCFVTLDRQADRGWMLVTKTFGIPADAFCTAELSILEPGNTSPYRQQVPTNLPAGKYRLRVGVEVPLGRSGRNVVVTTQAFTVTQ